MNSNLFLISLILLSIDLAGQRAQTVTDIDGNIYKTITIGTQMWMDENLKATHFRNGDAIPNITDSMTWSNLSKGAYCYYDTLKINIPVYGLLYNWYAITDSRNICPAEWHIPGHVELITLTDFLGGEHLAGAKLKEKGFVHWRRPNTGATNETGFTALPAGFRSYEAVFYDLGYYGFWWCSSKGSEGGAWGYGMYYFYGDVNMDSSEKTNGFSVRCIKDSD